MWKFAIAALVFLFGTREGAGTTPALPQSPAPDGPNGYQGIRTEVENFGRRAGWSAPSRAWLANMLQAQAWSESKGNRLAFNPRDSERDASKNLFFARDNSVKINAALGGLRPTVEDWYTPGSGGWFGLMPATIVNVVGGRDATGASLDALWVYDARQSVVGYVAYLTRLVRRSEWLRSSQDAYALKIGGAAGSLMDDPQKARSQTAMRHLDDAVRILGLPESFKTDPAPSELFESHNWISLMGPA